MAGLDDTPALSHFESIVTLAGTAARWLDQEQVGSQAVRWLTPLTQTLLPLAGVGQIPPGPGPVSYTHLDVYKRQTGGPCV